MPTKPKEAEEVQEELFGFSFEIKQIVRIISNANRTVPEENVWAVEEVDGYVSGWIKQGYKLHSTHFVGSTPSGFTVLYILVKEEV